MPVQILMPALSPTMEKGNLAKWIKKEGDEVVSGDIIAEIETDKATMEVEAVDEGKLGKILIEEGAQDIAVNTPIAIILGEGESEADIDKAASSEQKADTKVDAEIPAKPDEANPTAQPPETGTGLTPLEAAVPQDWPADTKTTPTSVREALRDAMAEEMRNDEGVFVMGEEVAEYQGAYKVTQNLLQEFGKKRVIDTPITEQGFAGLAVGAGLAGLKPIVEFMTFNFAMQAIDQIVNSAAKTLYMSGGQMGCNITFRGPNGAAARVGAQHSQDFAAWYSSVPGLKVIAPYTAADAKGLLKSAIRDPNPIVFLENEILYGQTFDVPQMDDFTIPIGKARLAREGSDVTIISWSIGMTYAHKAAEALAELGISAEILDLRTLRPLDTGAILASIQKTNRCVVVEEGWKMCGMSAEIASLIMEEAFDYLDAPVLRVAGKDVPMPYAANLEKLALPSVEEVVQAVRAVTYK